MTRLQSAGCRRCSHEKLATAWPGAMRGAEVEMAASDAAGVSDLRVRNPGYP